MRLQVRILNKKNNNHDKSWEEYQKYLKSFSYRRKDYGGEFPIKKVDFNYEVKPVHEGGSVCRVIQDEGYIDGSACGIGKSEAAWKSIRNEESVLCLSYRKSFTDKTKADYGLECYREIKGEIVYRVGDARRVITQIESITRISGIPDVLVLDEWHGIRRQMIGSNKKSKSIWEKFVGLVATAKRVIVLDALANNDDLELFRKYLNRPEIKFINNDYKVDHGKKFIVARTHQENLEKMIKVMLDGNRAVIFTHNKRYGNYSVEELAKLLQRLGFRMKYYHADTDPEEKMRDFSNVVEAFADVDAVIYNHTIEAGISIVDERFKRCFVFSEEVGSAEATKQALHRFRCITEINYSFTAKNHIKIPINRADIIEAIEQRERNCSEEELKFRSPNFNDLHTGFGHVFISEVIEENNSRCYFTGRLVKMMKDSGFEVIWELPDEFETWKENKNKKRTISC